MYLTGAKHEGPGGTEVGISLFFAVPGADPQGFIDFKLFTLNGLWATLDRTDTGASGVWHEGKDPGTATLAQDGSSASLDVTVGGASLKAPVHVSGTIQCAPAPPA